jgi:hypothetical protein
MMVLVIYMNQSQSTVEGYEEVENFLKSLDTVMIDSIITAYKSFEVYDTARNPSYPITTIMLCIAETGCYYTYEINAALRCLRQTVMLYQSGCRDVTFSPYHWEALCTVENIFGTIQGSRVQGSGFR